MRRRWYWVGGIVLSLGAIVFSLYAVYVGFTRITMLRDDAMLIQSVSVYGPVGSNSVFVETDAGGVLVDSFLPLLAWKLEDALDDTDSRVHTLVNTHWHPDHNGGNGRFREEADIVVHLAPIARALEDPTGARYIAAADRVHHVEKRHPELAGTCRVDENARFRILKTDDRDLRNLIQ